MMGLAQAMYAVQEQLPSLLKGKPIHAPSTLVHQMFAKYSNGTKTEADLASIDKGLDELFFHDFSSEDNERLVDFIGAGDLFNQETITVQPPQLVSCFSAHFLSRRRRKKKKKKLKFLNSLKTKFPKTGPQQDYPLRGPRPLDRLAQHHRDPGPRQDGRLPGVEDGRRLFYDNFVLECFFSRGKSQAKN